VTVAADDNWRGEAGQMHIAVELGQRAFGGRAKPKDRCQRGQREQNQKSAAGPEKNSRPAAFAARLSGVSGYWVG